jgi:acetoin utilization deacetylase AcuC-like enzyme
MATGYLTHARLTEHTLPGHPEHAGRIEAVWAHLARDRLIDRMTVLEPSPVTHDQMVQVHTEQYISVLASLSNLGDRMMRIDADTYVGPTSFEVARLAAGGLVRAIDAVQTGTVDNALVVVRPPGHHAMPGHGMGFCLLNSVAIGAAHARLAYGLERILIVDYDVHHGNGTEAMFYDDNTILFISTHQYPFYPGTGAIGDTGAGAGAGFTLNIPLAPGHGDASYAALYEHIIWPSVARFKPQLIVVSAGFDAHWDDPLASLQLSLNGYAQLTRELIAMADAHCEGRIIFLMEGGYNLDVLAHGVGNIAYALLGDETVSDPMGPAPRSDRRDVNRLVAELKALHRLS